MPHRRLRRRAALYAAALLVLPACATARPDSTPIPESAPPSGEEEIGPGPDVSTMPEVAVVPNLLGDADYDLPLVANGRVAAELDFLTTQRREVLGRWLERSAPYRPMIEETLEANGLPRDLLHLAMIESGFVPTARSHAGAAGMWQFMPRTGRAEGLRVDTLVDERLDPVRSTRAAARHLRGLYRVFGDWALAAAAYNAGSGRIRRGMEATGARDFWALARDGDLARETQHYVPRLYAATIVGRDPARFGFSAPSAARFTFDSLRVDLQTPLGELARIGGVDEAALARLNPHLVRRVVPKDYWVWAPSGRGSGMQIAWDGSEFRRNGGYGVYVIRSGDVLGVLAQSADLSVRRVVELNPGLNPDRIQPGQRIRLPALAARALTERPQRAAAAPAAAERTASTSTGASEPASPSSSSSASSSSRSSASPPARAASTSSGASAPSSRPAPSFTGEHVVQAGESLWALARRYDVTVDDLRAANDLDGDAIRIGRTLRVPAEDAPGSAPRESAGTARPALATAAPAPSSASSAASSARPAESTEATEHVVVAGETLWSLAQKYGTTVDAIRAANELGGDAIRIGQTLRIPRGES